MNDDIGQLNKRSDDCKMSDMKIIKIEKEDPYKILYKTSYAQDNFCILNVKKPRTTVKKRNHLMLQPLYKAQIKIPDKKKKGLLELLEKKHIPSRHADFYNNL